MARKTIRLRKEKKTTTAKDVADKVTRDDGRRDDGTFKGKHPWAFKPGQSGNPEGRRRAASVSAAYREKLGETEKTTGLTYAELIAEGMIHAAITGKSTAAVEVRKATEGDKIVHEVDWKGILRANDIDPDVVFNEMIDYVGELIKEDDDNKT